MRRKNSNKHKTELTDELGENNEKIVELKLDIDKLTEDIAQAREELVEAEEQTTDDKAYLEELTAKCHKDDVEFDQRASLRGGEVEAFTKALDIMKEKVDGWEDREIEEEDGGAGGGKKFVQTAEHPVAVKNKWFRC